MIRRAAFLILLPAMLSLGACDSIRDMIAANDKAKNRIPGERISVLAYDSQLDPDPALADIPVLLPRPWANADWPQAGGYPSHAMHHLALAPTLNTAWTADIGAAGDDETKILGQPVVAEGLIFTKDAATRVSAFEVATGRRLWRVNFTPKGEDTGAVGGGMAYADGKLFLTTAYGDVMALQPRTGLIYWHQALSLPVRGAPAVDGGRLFVITQDNQTIAMEAETGRQLWAHNGLNEIAGLVGAANPAIEGNIVVVPYSSGELVALRADTGTVAWSEQLVRTAGRTSAVGALNDINGRPVIDRGRVYAISQSGRFLAIDLRTGERIWERAISSVQTPWVAGDFIYVVTVDAEIVCLARRDGKVKWIRQLQRYKDPTARTNKGLINWYGPVLAGDRLLLASTTERAYAISPYNGDLVGAIKLSGPASVSPVVAGGTAFILTEDARLTALR